MPPPDNSEPSVHELICFGVGDGWPSFGRNHSSFLYRLGPDAILIDCGESVSRAYRKSGLDWNAFDRIFLSHFHADHVGGLFMLIQGCWLMRREKPLKVHLPVDGIEPIQKMLWAACLFEDAMPFDLIYEPLEPGQTVEVGEAQVTPYLTTHLDRLKAMYGEGNAHRFQSFSFLLQADGCRYGHSADIGAPSDLDSMTLAPLDHLVCELAHLSPDALAEYLATRSIRRLGLTHLSQELWAEKGRLVSDPPFDSLGIPVRALEDGAQFTLRESTSK